nr:MAK10-like protein [Tanacetum cinerariifolium]
MENLEQAFVDYASSHTDEAGGLVSEFMTSQEARLSKFEEDFKQKQSEMSNIIDTVLKAITDRIALLEDLAFYDNESWNNPRDFAKPIKAIALAQDVLSTSDRHLIKLETQIKCLMEAYLAPTQPTQVKKNHYPCEICNGPHDTQYCMENLEQAFVDYASSHTDEAGGKWYTFKPEQNNLGDTYNPSWRSHPNLRWRQP